MQNADHAWRSLELKCSSIFPVDLKIMNQLLDNPTFNANQKQSLLKQYNLAPEKFKMANEVMGQKNYDQSLELNKIEKYFKLNIGNLKKHQLYFENKKFKKYIKESHSLFIERLFMPLIALRANNQSWFKTAIAELLHTDPRRVLFLEDSSQKLDENFFKELLNLYFINLENDFWKTAFKFYFNQFDGISYEESLPTISDIRETLKNIENNKLFYPIWIESLYRNGTKKELTDYFNSVTTLEKIDRMDIDQFMVFEFDWPRHEIKREILVKKLKEMQDSKDIFNRFVANSLFQQEVVRSSFKQSNLEIKDALFSINRNFYLQQLLSGQGSSYALYSLLKLGDLNESYLWWLVL